MPAPIAANWGLIRTLWPMAWRNGALALGTFFIQSASTLICSRELGLEATASYGLTIQIVGLLMTLSMTWVVVKLPVINRWRTARETEKITTLFVSRLRIALLTFVFGALAVTSLANPFLQTIGAKTLLLPAAQLALLFLIYFLEMNHSCHAAVVISENVNPFVLPALLSGVAVVAISAWLTPYWAMWGIIFSFGFVQLAFNNWWPVLRAIKGLGLRPGAYGRRLLGLRQGES
jgi:O-antigen/teichoic acid export membrane protein